MSGWNREWKPAICPGYVFPFTIQYCGSPHYGLENVIWVCACTTLSVDYPGSYCCHSSDVHDIITANELTTFFFSRLIHGSCIFPFNLGNHLLKKQIGLETYLSKAIKFNLLSCPIRRQPEMNRVRFRKKIWICSLQPYCAHQPGGHTRHSVVKPASWEFLGYKKKKNRH